MGAPKAGVPNAEAVLRVGPVGSLRRAPSEAHRGVPCPRGAAGAGRAGLGDRHLPRRQHLHRPARVPDSLPRGEGGRSDRGPADPSPVHAEPLHLAGLQRAAGSEQPVQPDRLGARHPRTPARRRELGERAPEDRGGRRGRGPAGTTGSARARRRRRGAQLAARPRRPPRPRPRRPGAPRISTRSSSSPRRPLPRRSSGAPPTAAA